MKFFAKLQHGIEVVDLGVEDLCKTVEVDIEF